MPAPIHRLSKLELVRLAKTHCQAHGHSYLSHYNCYLNENPEDPERIGYLDIEASNLDADFGIMLSYCIKDGASKKIYQNVITKDDIDNAEPGAEDTRVVKSCVHDMIQFDRLVTWYGTGFDIPFIRTRAVICDVGFPPHGSPAHTDLYYVGRSRFKLSSNRLENACRVILGKTQKTRIEPRYWRAAVRGDKASLQYVVKHNEYDVIDLQLLHEKIEQYAAKRNKSI